MGSTTPCQPPLPDAFDIRPPSIEGPPCPAISSPLHAERAQERESVELRWWRHRRELRRSRELLPWCSLPSPTHHLHPAFHQIDRRFVALEELVRGLEWM